MPSFEEQLAWGEEGEQLVASILIRRGSAVAPLYQFNADSAPILLTTNSSLILPDLTCWNDGENYFAECKRKNQWVEWKGRLETGLDQKHFKHYERVKATTGQRVFLFFVHEDKNPNLSGVYFEEIHRLKPHARWWDGCKPNGAVVGKPLVLFPKNELKQLEEYRGAA